MESWSEEQVEPYNIDGKLMKEGEVKLYQAIK